jgi:rhodanese-related sulfurtransferase
VNIPLNNLRERVAEVPRDGTVVIHCAGGYRSSIGASILEAEGLTDLMDLVGGFAAWEKAHATGEASGAS